MIFFFKYENIQLFKHCYIPLYCDYIIWDAKHGMVGFARIIRYKVLINISAELYLFVEKTYL